jgi:hypothetical protein
MSAVDGGVRQRTRSAPTVNTVSACVMIVIVDPSAEHGSREEHAWFESLPDAIVAAVAMIEARGWTLGSIREQFLAGGTDYDRERGCVSEMCWSKDEDGWPDKHVGAVYASKLSTTNGTAKVTRSYGKPKARKPKAPAVAVVSDDVLDLFDHYLVPDDE